MIRGIIFDLNGVLFYFNSSSTPNFVEENVKLVEKLSLKYDLGVISNANDNYKRYLEQKDILKFFKTITLSEMIGFRKPDKEIFEITLEQMDLKPEEVVFIDDMEENIEVASALKINTILYENTTQLRERLLSFGVEV